MYTHLTTYDTTRQLAAVCRQGSFDGRRPRRPVRRLRHALSALARRSTPAPAPAQIVPTMPWVHPC